MLITVDETKLRKLIRELEAAARNDEMAGCGNPEDIEDVRNAYTAAAADLFGYLRKRSSLARALKQKEPCL